MIETARFDENRSHRGTSLRNSEHLQQEDTSTRLQRERERQRESKGAGGGKVINKSTGNHDGIQTEAGVEECLQNPKGKSCPTLNSRPNHNVNEI